jgi:hypothetical protein
MAQSAQQGEISCPVHGKLWAAYMATIWHASQEMAHGQGLFTKALQTLQLPFRQHAVPSHAQQTGSSTLHKGSQPAASEQGAPVSLLILHLRAFEVMSHTA